MSASNLAGAAVAIASFYSLWWCLALTRRLAHIERTLKPELRQAAEAGQVNRRLAETAKP